MISGAGDIRLSFHWFASLSVHLQDVLWIGVTLPGHWDCHCLHDDPSPDVYQLWPQIAPHGEDDVIVTSFLKVVHTIR